VNLLPAVFRAASDTPTPPDTAAMAAHSERTGLASIFGI
jgi:hypothetical protein